MSVDVLFEIGLFAVGAIILGRWFYKNVWIAPKVVRATVDEKSTAAAGGRLPDAFPGAGGVYAYGSTTNLLVLQIGERTLRCTANDESWRKVRPGDEIKAWIQNENHVVGVYVVNRAAPPLAQG
ncbi:MAG: hypothetical protein ACM3XM_02440 [Mycobacterium leprae]